MGERAGSKPRLALPLEENRPRVEGGAPGSAKEAAEIRDEKNLTPATKSAAGSPTAQLPPEPESSRPAREAGAPEPAAASAVAPSAQEETRADRGTIRMCGVVKDAGGRPVPSATVTLVSQGSGVTSDAEGGFCIEGLPGEHTISVIAVGFGPLRLDVRFVSGAPPLALSLIPVSVLGEGEALRGKLRMLQGAPLTGSPGASQSMPPDSLERVEAQAMRLTLEADRAGSVPRYEAAAAEWERVRDHTPEGAANLDARFRIAEARYHAWALAPTPRRASAADEALTSYLVRAPLGARRNTATVWLGRVKS